MCNTIKVSTNGKLHTETDEVYCPFANYTIRRRSPDSVRITITTPDGPKRLFDFQTQPPGAPLHLDTADDRTTLVGYALADCSIHVKQHARNWYWIGLQPPTSALNTGPKWDRNFFLRTTEPAHIILAEIHEEVSL